MRKPRLTIAQILRWADAHHKRTGRWPSSRSGPIPEAPGETWNKVASALVYGTRGLPSGQSLPQLLAERRGHRNKAALPPLSEALILRWAQAHHAATGRYPKAASGPVAAAPGEHWRSLDMSLRRGWRGLPGGDSLARLLMRHGRTAGLWGGPGKWTDAEDALVRRLSATEVASQTGRTLSAVYARRSALGLTSAGQHRPKRAP
jgi:hypothetical protein